MCQIGAFIEGYPGVAAVRGLHPRSILASINPIPTVLLPLLSPLPQYYRGISAVPITV